MKYICIHGHFYQPPRENPWLEWVEVQDSASPFHDWNQRVCAECYAPNAAARILGPKGNIDDIASNYRHISFNFGPTLLSWLQEHSRDVYQALLEADQYSREQWGSGNALAQVYNHVIMPLAGRRDKLTQIRWGKGDFISRFGREPLGMWLAETAVDNETLSCLAAEGIRFTILAPHQAEAVRPIGEEKWQKAPAGGVEPRRPYLVKLGDGLEIAVFFYDGPMSRAVAFENLLQDGAKFAARLQGLFSGDIQGNQIVSLATDGETYGHHHRFGEMGLAYALKLIGGDPEARLTNYSAYLAENPPEWEAKIAENTSWSCAHGIKRWQAHCGCALDPGRGWSQAWREPLRKGLERLGQRLEWLYEEQGAGLFKDPWQARDEYWRMLPPASMGLGEFLNLHQARPLEQAERIRAAKLLECQRFSQYMFTSCAWFFDDISGIEPVQNLRYAARALQLAEELGGGGLEEELLEELGRAESNIKGEGTGAMVWKRRVRPAKVGPRRVAAHAAIRGVMSQDPPPKDLYCYDLETVKYHQRGNLGLYLCWGEAMVSHRSIGHEHHLAFAALHPGGHEFTAWVNQCGECTGLEGLGETLEGHLRLLEQGPIEKLFEERIGGARHTMADLFLEGRRTLARAMLSHTLGQQRETARALFESSRETMLFLRSINVPLPELYSALARAVILDDLVSGLEADGKAGGAAELGRSAQAAKALGLNLDTPALRLAMEKSLTSAVSSLAASSLDPGCLERALGVLSLAQVLGIKLDLWESQNVFQKLRRKRGPSPQPAELKQLGRLLGFTPG